MTTTNLLNVLLTVHITGLTVAGGLSVSNFLAARKYRMAWADSRNQLERPPVVALPQLSRLFWTGIAMLLISGAAMMHMAYQAFMMQFWFQAKLALIVLIVLNAIVISRQARRLKNAALKEKKHYANPLPTGRNRNIISILSGIQLIFFLLIFVLAVFRFTY